MGAISNVCIMYIAYKRAYDSYRKDDGKPEVCNFGKLNILDLAPLFKTQVKANMFIFISLDFKDTY